MAAGAALFWTLIVSVMVFLRSTAEETTPAPAAAVEAAGERTRPRDAGEA